MKEIYYIEIKIFYDSENGVIHQAADMGSTPILVSSYKKALLRLEEVRDNYTRLFGYYLERNYSDEEIGVGDCFARFILVRPANGMRAIVSLYKVWID